MIFKDRILEFRRVPASELRANPKNWREHPSAQRKALEGVLVDVGFAQALPVYADEDGKLTIIDGHLRADIAEGQDVPCLLLDVTEAEANLLLATLDPIAAMAKTNDELLSELLDDVGTGEAGLRDLLDDLYPDEPDKPKAGLKDVERPPPELTWVLLGVPTTSYGDISELVDRVSLIDDAVIEMTVKKKDD